MFVYISNIYSDDWYVSIYNIVYISMITYMYVYTYMGTILFLMKAWGSPIRYYRNSKIFSRLQLWGQKLSKVKQPLSLNSNKFSSHSWSLPCFDMVAQAARHCRSKDVSNICSWRKSTCILAEDWCTLCKFHCSIICWLGQHTHV